MGEAEKEAMGGGGRDGRLVVGSEQQGRENGSRKEVASGTCWPACLVAGGV